MTIQWNGTSNLGNALLLMLLGMVGIFLVMGIILGVVVLLNKVSADSDKEKDNTNK